MNPTRQRPVQVDMSDNTHPHGAVETIDELDFYPFGVPSELQVPPPRQTYAEIVAQHHDFDRRMEALADRRITANGGRDGAGDVVYRHGRLHPAYRGPGLRWLTT